MQGSLSPLMLIAGQGLLQNSGLGQNADMLTNIAAYETLTPVSTYQLALASGNATSAMQSFANSSCPALTHVVPGGTSRLNDYITTHSNNILGNGDLSKFVVQMFTSMSYAQTSSEFIDGANTANDYLGNTFENFDMLVTGGISGVSMAFEEFGNDLIGTGAAINFNNLQHYGSPHSLIVTLVATGILEFIYPELIAHGINPEATKLKIISQDNSWELSLVAQKKCYEAFKTVTGEKLDVIKSILRVTSTDITTLADIIDTHKLFPASRQTLTSVTKDGHRGIYVNDSGSVNEQFKNLGKDYYSVMPRDICDANQAFKRSLQQVKNITEMNSVTLGNVVKGLETNYGLDQINDLNQPLPSDTHSYYTTSFASGSGTNGRFYLSDFIGTPAGIAHADAYASVKETLDYLNNQGALDNINDAFVILDNWLRNVYGTPDGSTLITIPGYGSHTDYDSGVDAILADVDTMITTLTNNYPTEVASLNAEFNAMNTQISNELTNLALAGVVFAETPSSPSSTQSMVANLHLYAIQDDFRGVAEMLEKMADTTTRAGQALVGALREGRNLSKLGTIGVGTDALPHDVTQPTDSADISPGKYSLTEALNSVILD
jgi:predicted transcriptional regulator